MFARRNRFARILRVLLGRTPKPARTAPAEEPREARTSECESAARSSAADVPYREALDAVETATVLLDGELRVRFFNLAFRRLAGIEPHAAESPVRLEDLARKIYGAHGRYAFPDQMEISIANCVAAVCDEEPRPFQFWLIDGRMIRQTCTLLDDGSRLLTYHDITEQTWQRDELDSLRAALDEVNFGVVVVDDRLRARFINKAFRRAIDLLDDFADSKPSIVEILEHARRTSALHIPPSEFDAFIKQRLKLIREGRPVLHRMQLSGGQVIQSQIIPLSGGGRLLTYACINESAPVAAPALAPQ